MCFEIIIFYPFPISLFYLEIPSPLPFSAFWGKGLIVYYTTHPIIPSLSKRFTFHEDILKKLYAVEQRAVGGLWRGRKGISGKQVLLSNPRCI